MLKSIHVENMALIDEADVSMTDGLNILTGETGAGKSIIIGSVNMALGGNASRDMIRTGADYALSELDFEVDDKRILDSLDEMGLPVTDDHVVISRRITNGRSIARINGEMVSLSVLRGVSSLLIDIHGQHEHQSLLSSANHMKILDKFARDELSQPAEELKAKYNEYSAINRELNEAETDESKRKSEISYLKFQVEEIDEADLREGEEEELDTLFRKMSNARELLESTAQVHRMTGYDDPSSGGNIIGEALRELSSIERYDEDVSGLMSQLTDIDGLLNDFNRELADYEDTLVFDEETYAQTESRLDQISSLKSKYGNNIEDILRHRDECEEQLEKLENYEEYLEDLNNRHKRTESELKKLSDKVSRIRRRYADELQEKIKSAMMDLNFPDVRFEIDCEKLDHFTAGGQDSVQFMISTNPGEAMRPLSRVASGGEMSRIMLAIKSVLADTDEIPTLIFDEIDTGISGRTAQKVSEKMALIAKTHQVICITHLPQIASMADSHFLIEKSSEDGRTRTQIRRLNDDEAVDEVARLLGGVRITDAVLENAREMRQLAQKTKQRSGA